MKCAGTFSKGHLALCPVRDTTCTSCKYRGHFTRLCQCRGKNVNIVYSQIVHNTGCNYPSEQPDVNNYRVNRECCGVINAWSESRQSDNDGYSVSNITTIYHIQRKELKKFLNIGIGIVILNLQVNSSSPVSFVKRNVLHKLKLQKPCLNIYAEDQSTKELNCGLTDNALNITGRLISPIISNGWFHNECHFFQTEGYVSNFWGNNNLQNLQSKSLKNAFHAARP